jgi:PilZ domain-containing protein
MAMRKKAKGSKQAAGPARKRPEIRKRKPAAKKIDTTAAPRCRSRIPVEIEAGGRRERGAIADMSASGARIVGVQLDLPPGTPISIRYGSATAPILLSTEMVRATADGFAVKMLNRRRK